MEHEQQHIHSKHEGHSLEMFAWKFWLSLVLALPIIFVRLGLEFPNSDMLVLVLGSAIFFYGGWVFIQGAKNELQNRLPGMMTLITVAITTAYVYSVYAAFARKEALFWELATLITIMLLGHWLEMRAVAGAKGALKELAKLLPDVAEVIKGNETVTIKLAELALGDLVLVRPGGKIPADGKVTEGQSEVDESLITGESKPINKPAGAEVIAGTINGSGSLKVEVTKLGQQTFLAGIMRLVSEAETSKSKLQILSDRAAFYLTIIAVLGGFMTLFVWIAATKNVGLAVERMVAVLVIACPHALGLAVPLVASISTSLAARNGFLVKKRLGLESARKISIVLFDKTGTLTKGEFGVTNVMGDDKNKALSAAAAVNKYSEHSLAKAVVAEAKSQNLGLTEVSNFQSIPGQGVRAEAAGMEILVGTESLLTSNGIRIQDEIKGEIKLFSEQGKTVVHVSEGGEYIGSIALADIIREESRQAVKSLQLLGIKVAMVTGDTQDVADWVSGELGIDQSFARVLPHQKADKVRLLQSQGHKVAMVGDGVNDAPALTQADVGIAVGAGTNVAIESADIILAKNDPRDISKIIKLSKATYSKMIQNLFWATGYNVVALPLAAGLLAPYGIILAPAFGAVLMSLSTIIVAINAQFLRRLTL